MFSATKLIAVAACAQSAFAALYVRRHISVYRDDSDSISLQMTSPVASTVWTAGQPQQISWQDDGQTYNLQAFGQASVSIGVGNAIQQVSTLTIISVVPCLFTGLAVAKALTLLSFRLKLFCLL